MTPINRRTFLKAGATATIGALAGSGLAFATVALELSLRKQAIILVECDIN